VPVVSWPRRGSEVPEEWFSPGVHSPLTRGRRSHGEQGEEGRGLRCLALSRSNGKPIHAIVCSPQNDTSCDGARSTGSIPQGLDKNEPIAQGPERTCRIFEAGGPVCRR